MSTSRKLMVKLDTYPRSSPKQRCAARKATPALPGTQFVCFYHWLSGRKLFAGLSLFTCTFQRRCQTPKAHKARQHQAPLLAMSTVMPSRKQYPKELGKRLTEHGWYEFWCRGGLCSIAWKDRKPSHFLSN